MVHHFFILSSHILSDKRWTGDNKTCSEGNHEKCYRKAHRNSGNGGTSETTNPKCISKLICTLKYLSKNNWYSKGEEQTENKDCSVCVFCFIIRGLDTGYYFFIWSDIVGKFFVIRCFKNFAKASVRAWVIRCNSVWAFFWKEICGEPSCLLYWFSKNKFTSLKFVYELCRSTTRYSEYFGDFFFWFLTPHALE